MSKGRPKAYESITYEELGDYVGKKGVIKVSKPWLDSVMGEISPQKAQGVPSDSFKSKSNPPVKECSKCNETLPLHKFNNDKRRKFGKRSQCKKCANKQYNKSNVIEESHPPIEYKLTDFNKTPYRVNANND